MKKKQLTLKDYEAHIASMCVAIVSGGIGGALYLLTKKGVCLANFMSCGHHPIYPIGAAFISWYAAWLVCRNAFPSAHHWYGHGSWSHRIYDTVGIASGVLVYWLLR